MISIIIPCFNSKNSIKKCIKSIHNQTYKDIEILIVDDCSTDDSLYIYNEFKLTDKRIKLILLKENSGVDNARFIGINYAAGKYLMFLDSDDWLSNKYILQKLYDEAISSDADYVEMGIQRVLDRHGIIKKKSNNQITGIIDQPELFDKFYISFFGVNLLSVSMCGKLYKASTIKKANIQKSGLHLGEDLHFNLMLFPHLNKISILKETGYSYRFGGVTTKYNPYLIRDMINLYNIKKELISKYNYSVAFKYIIIEMINVLRSEIRQSIRYTKDKTNIINKLQHNYLNLEIWHDLKHLKKENVWQNNPFVKSIINKDAEQFYSLCEIDEKKDCRLFLIKKIASKMLSFI